MHNPSRQKKYWMPLKEALAHFWSVPVVRLPSDIKLYREKGARKRDIFGTESKLRK